MLPWRKKTYVKLRLLTLTSLHLPSGEQVRDATTDFSFPDEVPEMLQGTSQTFDYDAIVEDLLVEKHILN